MVIILATKKKFKLKKKFRRLIFFVVLLAFLAFIGNKCYESIKYHKTEEYAFLSKGYDLESYKIVKEKMSKGNISFILKGEKIDYIGDLVKEKYYIDENLKEYLAYFDDNSKKDFSEVVAIVNVGADENWYEESSPTKILDKYSILVNKFSLLPEDYDPGTTKKFSATYAYGEVSAEETTYHAFIEMAKAAKEEGFTLILTSGYRTNAYQKKLYDDMKTRRGEEYADKYAARPRSSEHETGLALDILTYGGLTDTFKTTETYKWLHEHSYEYGFIERYEEEKEHLTGYEPEAWHYRYLGKELAKKVHDEGITYDEYYAFYLAR